MLVVSRRIGERIMVGEDIVIEITSIRGNYVGVGVAAPQDVLILREELLEGEEVEDECDY